MRLAFVLGAAAVAASAAEPAEPGVRAALDRALAQSPGSVPLLSRRGDLHLWSGNFAAAVADFERMIAEDPRQDAPHWRLGIAYYLQGQFAKSSRQFGRYHAHDARDRENGLWKFMADARMDGVQAARGTMLAYTRFDREPFPDLHALYAGQISRDQFFDGLKTRGLDRDPRIMFFARYYAGVLAALQGNPAQALPLVRAAVTGPWGQREEDGGPAYMWRVARLHLAVLEGEAAAGTKP